MTIWSYVRPLGPFLGPGCPLAAMLEPFKAFWSRFRAHFGSLFGAILASFFGPGFRTRFGKDLGHFFARFGARPPLKNNKKRSEVGRISWFSIFWFNSVSELVLRAFWHHFGVQNRGQIGPDTAKNMRQNLNEILEPKSWL